jgi:hypothetical protein
MLTPKENMLRAIRRQNPQWVPNGMDHVHWVTPPVVERPAQAGRDAFAVAWDFEPTAEGGTFPAHGGQTITNLSRWRQQITFPDLSRLDWAPLQRWLGQVDRTQYLLMGFCEMGLFERTYLLLGMEAALEAFLTEPQAITDLVGAIADYKITLLERFAAEIPLDMVWYGDDWGTQQNLFLPPAVWRAIIRPHTQRIYDCLKRRGLLINQHSCGRIESIFPDLVEMGADMWNPCQPCNDLAALKKQFGTRISFCGGIDSQFVLARPDATPAEVRKEVALRIEQLAPGGGYIAAPSHGVPYRPEIVQALNDAIADFGASIYQPVAPVPPDRAPSAHA